MRADRGMQFLRALLACLALLLGALPGAQAAMASLGPVTGLTRLANGAQLALSGGGSLRVAFLAGGIVNVEAAPPGVKSLPTTAVLPQTPATDGLVVHDDGSRVYLVQGGLSVIVTKNPLQVVVMRNDGTVLSADVPGGTLWDSATGVMASVKMARAGERYFGMGLAGGPLDRRGRQMLMKNSDRAAYGEFTSPLYSSTPFFHGHLAGVGSYGYYLDSPALSYFDFDAANNGQLLVVTLAGTLNYYVMAGPAPADVARAFATLTGTTPLPPRWALGYLQAHFGYASAAEVLGLAREFRNLAIPCDAFFLDLDYTDRLFTLTWNPTGFPDPIGFNSQMEGMGFKRVTIIEPLVTTFDPLWPWLAGNNWLVKDGTGQPLVTPIWMGDVSFIDFTKAAASDFFRTQLTTFLKTGVNGLWADLNEPAANEMPHAVFDFDGQPRSETATRNIYALVEMPALHRALQDAHPGQRPFIVSRSGFAGIQRYTANWSGDTESTFETLRVMVQISASMGLSGQNFFGHDIGGFLGSPNAELFLRWLQFGTVMPLMRNHSMNTSAPREPWRFGEPYTSVARATIELRYRLMPYLYGLFAQAEKNGAPVLGPTYFHFPNDTATHTQNGELMFGPSLLAAPVVQEGQRTRRLYLPAGTSWIDYQTDTRYTGGQTIELPAPLHWMPLLGRAGGIVPMGPVRQYAAQTAGVADQMVIDVFSGANGQFTLHDDDGATTAYRQGTYRDTPLTWAETATTAQLTVGPATGSLAAATRPWWLQVRAWPTAPTRITADGTVLPRVTNGAFAATGGWQHSGARLVIRLPGSQPPANVTITR